MKPPEATTHLRNLARRVTSSGQFPARAEATTFSNAAQTSASIRDAVTEQMKTGLSYAAAFNTVERQQPHLFAGMKRVEIIMPHRRKPITL